MKKLIALVFAILLVVGYSACGNSYKSPTAPATAPGMPTPTPGGPY